MLFFFVLFINYYLFLWVFLRILVVLRPPAKKFGWRIFIPFCDSRARMTEIEKKRTVQPQNNQGFFEPHLLPSIPKQSIIYLKLSVLQT